MIPVPDEVARLFWDVEAAAVDLEAHADYVMERVMSRGGWVAMKWLAAAYPRAALAAFIRRKGDRLAPRELAYWALIADVEVKAGPGGGRPRWAGP